MLVTIILVIFPWQLLQTDNYLFCFRYLSTHIKMVFEPLLRRGCVLVRQSQLTWPLLSRAPLSKWSIFPCLCNVSIIIFSLGDKVLIVLSLVGNLSLLSQSKCTWGVPGQIDRCITPLHFRH